jgi:hypothetical protein
LSIRFAILCDAKPLDAWQGTCLAKLCALSGVHPVALIGGAGAAPDPHLASTPRFEANAADLSTRMHALGLDFILTFASQPCPPALLAAARCGVWEFKLGDWIRYRGDAPAFWEVYDAAPVTGALLARLHGDGATVTALREGYVRTHPYSAARNLDQLTDKIAAWPAQLCIDLENEVPLPEATLVSRAARRSRPTAVQLLIHRCRAAQRLLCLLLRSLFRHDQWNVGCVERPIESWLAGGPVGEVRWLARPRSFEFKADPFGVTLGGRRCVLYEHFDYRRNFGTIAAAELDGARAPLPVEVGPDVPAHLSYPYVLEHEERLFCIPESSGAREVALYELERFPDRWRRVATLLEGVGVVDATVFQHDGRWWLAGSEPTTRGTTCELNLWHAPELRGPWTPHAGNPVRIDVRSTRPGGTPFRSNGELYRPAQDCSTTYGGRIVINRVLKLTPTAFREEPVATVEPAAGWPYHDGLHTLARIGGATLIDAKRVMFSPAEFRRVLAHHLRTVLRL